MDHDDNLNEIIVSDDTKLLVTAEKEDDVNSTFLKIFRDKMLPFFIKLDTLIGVLGLVLLIFLASYYFGVIAHVSNDDVVEVDENIVDFTPLTSGSVNPIWIYFVMMALVMMSFSGLSYSLKNATKEECNPEHSLKATALWIIGSWIATSLVLGFTTIFQALNYLHFQWPYIIALIFVTLIRAGFTLSILLYTETMKRTNSSLDEYTWHYKFTTRLERRVEISAWIRYILKSQTTEMTTLMTILKPMLIIRASFDKRIAVFGLIWGVLLIIYHLVGLLLIGENEFEKNSEISDLSPEDFGLTTTIWGYLFVTPIVMMVCYFPGLLLENALQEDCEPHKALRKIAFWIILNVGLILTVFGLGVWGYFLLTWEHTVLYLCVVGVRLQLLGLVLKYTSEMKKDEMKCNKQQWYFIFIIKLEQIWLSQ